MFYFLEGLLVCEVRRTLDLGLDIVDGVGRLHLEGDSLTRKGLDEDLHLYGRPGNALLVHCLPVWNSEC